MLAVFQKTLFAMTRSPCGSFRKLLKSFPPPACPGIFFSIACVPQSFFFSVPLFFFIASTFPLVFLGGFPSLGGHIVGCLLNFFQLTFLRDCWVPAWAFSLAVPFPSLPNHCSPRPYVQRLTFQTSFGPSVPPVSPPCQVLFSTSQPLEVFPAICVHSFSLDDCHLSFLPSSIGFLRGLYLQSPFFIIAIFLKWLIVFSWLR